MVLQAALDELERAAGLEFPAPLPPAQRCLDYSRNSETFTKPIFCMRFRCADASTTATVP